jgi:hypothetical protein
MYKLFRENKQTLPGDEEFSLNQKPSMRIVLLPLKSENNELNLPKLESSMLVLQPNMTIEILKKYLKEKLKTRMFNNYNDNDIDTCNYNIGIYYRNVEMMNHYTIRDIERIYLFTGEKTVFYYSRNIKDNLVVKSKKENYNDNEYNIKENNNKENNFDKKDENNKSEVNDNDNDNYKDNFKHNICNNYIIVKNDNETNDLILNQNDNKEFTDENNLDIKMDIEQDLEVEVDVDVDVNSKVEEKLEEENKTGEINQIKINKDRIQILNSVEDNDKIINKENRDEEIKNIDIKSEEFNNKKDKMDLEV